MNTILRALLYLSGALTGGITSLLIIQLAIWLFSLFPLSYWLAVWASGILVYICALLLLWREIR